MKRHCGLAIATFMAAALYGCGADTETGEGGGNQTVTGGTGGAGGAGGIYGVGGASGGAATGSTWAPVPAGSGGTAGGVSAGAGGVGVSGQGGMGPAGVGGASGMGPAGMGGMGPAGMGGMGPAGTGGMAATGDATPAIPSVAGECPDFNGGTITFMGLGGITVDSGPMPSSPTAPMVFYWHGTGSFAGEYAGMAADVVAGVRAEGGVLISFQGSTGGDFLSGTSVFGEGDFALVDQLVACAVENRNVDPRRIYTTGCSAGGLFSAALAAMRSSYIAAAAPNSGGFAGFPIQFENDYTPALMTVHGAPGSDVVIIDFSESSRTADMAFKNRGGFVINCNHGGGHCGGGGLAGSIWEFFKAHPYGVEPSPTPWTSLPAGFHSSCEIF